MELKDKKLQKLIKYKVGKFGPEELTEDDLKKVEELIVNNRGFAGEILDIDISEISNLSNLKILSLTNFSIDDSIIKLLNSFTELQSLQLIACDFATEQMINNPNLTNLIIRDYKGPEMPRCMPTEYFEIQNCPSLILQNIPNQERVKKLYLRNCNIKNFGMIKNYENLEFLSIDGSKIDDESVLNELSSKIVISDQPEFHYNR